MNVFLSWSGSKSKAIAEILKAYLPILVNQAEPWLSSQDIYAGSRWNNDIAKSLEASNTGILCVTADNQNTPWILFEAGAISKITAAGLAIVLRVDLKASEVVGPLSQFHSVGIERDDFYKMITTINKAGSSPVTETVLQTRFDALWGRINEAIEEALSAHATKAPAKRPDSEMIEELLELARRQDTVNQLLMAGTALIDRRLELKEQRDDMGITSAGVYNNLYGQPAHGQSAVSSFTKFAMLESLKPSSTVNSIYTDDALRKAAASAHDDIEHDPDDNKNE